MTEAFLDAGLDAGHAPFVIAALVLAGLLLLELASLLLGASLSGLSGPVDGPGTVDSGTEPSGAPGMAALALDWLNAGRLPLLMLLMVLLGTFSAAGFLLQGVVTATTGGAALPAPLAAALCAALAVPATRIAGRMVGRMVPAVDTYAVAPKDMVGRIAVVTLGPVRAGSVARARLKDRHGNLHFPRIEPAEPGAVIREGASVLVIDAAPGGSLKVVPLPAGLNRGNQASAPVAGCPQEPEN